MGAKTDLEVAVSRILGATWDVRDGKVVPSTDKVKLQGGAVKLEATVLYADLAESTQLAMKYHRQTSAKVYKCFLSCASKLIRDHGGAIRSFDGDRVMGVFMGNMMCTNAATCALKINYAVQEIIQPKIINVSEALKKSGFVLKHGVGIDVGEILVVRGGVRDNNDLVWVGRAPNIAAKLCGVRAGQYRTFITPDVYKRLNARVREMGSPPVAMWERRDWTVVEGMSALYRSKFVLPLT